MEYTAFISHSNKDDKAVKAIRGYLEGLGYSCFVSKRDLRHNDNWQTQLVEAMDASAMLIYIHSHNANESPEVSREINYFADRCHRPILVYRLSDEPYNNDKAYYVQSINYIDSLDDPSDGLENLSRNVQETLDGLNAKTYAGKSRTSLNRWALPAIVLLSLCVLGFCFNSIEKRKLQKSVDLCSFYLSQADRYLTTEDSLDCVFTSIDQAEQAFQKSRKLLTVKKPEVPDFQAERERCTTSIKDIRSRRIELVKALYEPLQLASKNNWSASVDAIAANLGKIHQIDSLLDLPANETVLTIENNIQAFL